MIKIIIFDLDGTLLDISEKYYRSVKLALEHFGFKCPPKVKIIELKRRNLSGSQLMDLLVPKNIKNRDKIKKVSNEIRYEILHSKQYLYFDKPFRNVYKILEKLKNKKIKLVILTGRFYKRNTIEQLKRLKLLKFFDLILVDKLNTINSKVMLIKNVLKKFKISNRDCYLVGDSLVEIKAGNLLKIPTIGVSYGLSEKRILSKKCCKIISDIKEILSLV